MITYKDIDAGIVSETELHTFTMFASDHADTRVGFPRELKTNIGNGMSFFGYKKKLDEDGDVLYVRYRQANGCVDLIVYND